MNLNQAIDIFGAGTSEGAKKAWEVRHRSEPKEPSSDDWKKVSGPKGSNPGGIYEDSKGVRYYAKQYKNQNQGKTEVIANKIFSALGILAPGSFETMIDGQKSVAAKMLPDAHGLSKEELRASPDIMKGFVADAWLANYDVIGLVFDNVMRSGGKDYRIDSGGTLFYRAQGGHKTSFEEHPNDVPELDSMRNPSIAREAGQVFNHLKDEDLKPQAKHLVDIMTDEKITSIVKEGKFDSLMEKKITSYLIGRRNGIAKRFKL